jgi:hypothetical protein
MRHWASGPVQVHEKIGFGDMLELAVRHPFGLRPVTGAVERIREPAC